MSGLARRGKLSLALALPAAAFLASCAGAEAVPRSPTPIASSRSTAASGPTPPAFDGMVVVDLGSPVAFVAAGDDAVWATVADDGSHQVLRIDPTTLEVAVAVSDLPPEPLIGVGVNGSVWVVGPESSVTEYDARTGAEKNQLTVGEFPLEPVLAYGDLWTLNHHDGTVSRIDTDTSAVVATIEVALPGPGGPLSTATAGGLLWVAAPNTPRIAGIDPETNEVVRTIELEPGCAPSISGAADWLWMWRGCQYRGSDVIDPGTLDPIGARRDVPEPFLTTDPLVVSGRTWVPVLDSATDAISELVAIDLGSLEVVEEVALGSDFGSAVVGFDSMWLTGEESLVRVPVAALRDD